MNDFCSGSRSRIGKNCKFTQKYEKTKSENINYPSHYSLAPEIEQKFSILIIYLYY